MECTSTRQKLMDILKDEEALLSRISQVLEDDGLADKNIVIEFKFVDTRAVDKSAQQLSLPLAANLTQISFTLCPSPQCIPPKIG